MLSILVNLVRIIYEFVYKIYLNAAIKDTLNFISPFMNSCGYSYSVEKHPTAYEDFKLIISISKEVNKDRDNEIVEEIYEKIWEYQSSKNYDLSFSVDTSIVPEKL